MSKARWLVFPLLTLGLSGASLSACGNGDGRPSSLVSFNGESGRGGSSGGHGVGGSGNAGLAAGDAGDPSAGEAGAAGEASVQPTPLAMFPEQLQVDVSCGESSDPTELLITNDGQLPLTITSATTTADYTVEDDLPLQIAPLSTGSLRVSAPKEVAALGHMSSGTLTFVTNEPGTPSHEVRLDTTVFGAKLEFADGDGMPLSGALALTYLSSDVCPDRVKYRVRNTGNLAVTLFGPTFPAHFGGSTTGASGRNLAPNGYVELEVSGDSATDGTCSGSGELSFTVQGSLCSAVPKLGVNWPANIATSDCSCVAASE